MLSTELFLNINYLFNNANLGKIAFPQCTHKKNHLANIRGTGVTLLTGINYSVNLTFYVKKNPLNKLI